MKTTRKPKPVMLTNMKYERRRARLISGKYTVQTQQAKRYTVRSSTAFGWFGIWDKQEYRWVLGGSAQFRTRAAAWRCLKNTTVEKYKLWLVNRALDGEEAA
jgi:hypothetical protein